MGTEVINGYVCRDCTDIDRARKNIDPAHPKDGPFRQDAPAKVEKARAQKAELTGHDPTQPYKPAEPPRLASSGDLGTRLHVLA